MPSLSSTFTFFQFFLSLSSIFFLLFLLFPFSLLFFFSFLPFCSSTCSFTFSFFPWCLSLQSLLFISFLLSLLSRYFLTFWPFVTSIFASLSSFISLILASILPTNLHIHIYLIILRLKSTPTPSYSLTLFRFLIHSLNRYQTSSDVFFFFFKFSRFCSLLRSSFLDSSIKKTSFFFLLERYILPDRRAHTIQMISAHFVPYRQFLHLVIFI